MLYRHLFSITALAGMFCCTVSVSLAEEQNDKKASDLFNKLDTNSDGKITSDEINEEQARFFKRLLRRGDQDEDGALSKQEFLKGSKESQPPQGQPANRPRGGQQVVFIDRLFEQADQDRDGKIRLKDLPERAQERLAPLFERIGKETITKEDLRGLQPRDPAARAKFGANIFDRLDVNGDGKLSAEEAPERGKRYVEMLLKRAGKNADATLSREEFTKLAMARRDGRPGDRPEMRGPRRPGGPLFLQQIDANKDGKISKEEWQSLSSKFDALDKNEDGVLDPREIFGPPPGRRGPEGEMHRRPDGERRRPEGDRPRRKRPPEQDKPRRPNREKESL